MTPHEATVQTAETIQEITGLPLSGPANEWLFNWYRNGTTRDGTPRATVIIDDDLVDALCRRLRHEAACSQLLMAAAALSSPKQPATELRVSALKALELPLSDPSEAAVTRLCNTDPQD